MSECKRSRTEITIETICVTTVRRRTIAKREIYCDRCLEDVAAVSLAQVTLIVGGDASLFKEMCLGGQIHLLSDSSVCGNSLARLLRNQE